MEKLIADITALIKSEHIHSERSNDITNLLHDYLIDYAKTNKSATHVDFKHQLERITSFFPHYVQYLDTKKLLYIVSQTTKDEEKLREDDIILDAKGSRQLLEDIKSEYSALEHSCLNMTKFEVMRAIRNAVYGRCGSCIHVFHTYDDSLKIVSWLRELGYVVEKVESQRETYSISW